MLTTAAMVTSSDVLAGLAGGIDSHSGWIDDVAADIKEAELKRAVDVFRNAATTGDTVTLAESLNEFDIEKHLDGSGTRALHLAAAQGHQECIKLLLARGADVDAKELGMGCTALLFATMGGHIETAKELVGAGADINMADNCGGTVLIKAVQAQNVQLVEEIARLGGVPVTRNSNGVTSTAYYLAQNFGNMDDRRKMLNAILQSRMVFVEDGGVIEAEEKNDLCKAMLQASSLGEQATMELLLSIGIEVNCIDVELAQLSYESVPAARHVPGSTPLHLAGGYGHSSCVQFLLDRGADVQLRDAAGQTAYQVACAAGHIECMQALYDAGSDIQARDKRDRTGRQLAEAAGKMDVVSLIDEFGRLDEEAKKQRVEKERQHGLLQEANDCYAQGDYEAALQKSTDLAITMKGRVRAQALCIRAKCHLAGRRFTKSRKDLAGALVADAQCTEATQLHSVVDLEEAQYDEQQAQERQQQLLEKKKKEAAARKAKEEKKLAREQQAAARKAKEAEKKAAQEQARLKAQEEKQREAAENQKRAAKAEERRQEALAKELARRREEETLAAAEAAKQAAAVAAAAKAAAKAAAEREVEQARIQAEAKAEAQARAKAQAERQATEGATVKAKNYTARADADAEPKALNTTGESEANAITAAVPADGSAAPLTAKKKKGKNKKRTRGKNKGGGGSGGGSSGAGGASGGRSESAASLPQPIVGDEDRVSDEPDTAPEILFGSAPVPEPEPEPEPEPKSAAALTAVSSYNAFLATLSPEQARQEVGMQLFNVVQGHLSMMTAKITGMLLENDLSTLTPLLTDPDRTELTGRIDEATAVILQAAAEMSATTSEVIGGSTESITAGADESRQDMPAAGSVASAPQLSPVPANWQQPMVHMQPPLSPPHVGQLQQLASEDQLQELSADMSSWNSQEALNWFTSTFSFADVYQSAFCQLRVDGDLLQHLTEDDLRDDLGMRSSIHRRAVMRAISAFGSS